MIRLNRNAEETGMNEQTTSVAARGEIRVVGPGDAKEFWQPVPANGHIAIHLAPGLVPMDIPLGLGTQTVAPGCYVREHAHDRHEEVIHCLHGEGRAVLDGVEHRLLPGMTIFIGKNRRHMFINDGKNDLQLLWVMTPNGLEDFFAAIGRPKDPGQPAPEPFPRPADVLEIERRTVFAPALKNGGLKP
jgi:hypothetical protein